MSAVIKEVAAAVAVTLTLCISEVSCSSVGEAVALRVSVPLPGHWRVQTDVDDCTASEDDTVILKETHMQRL